MKAGGTYLITLGFAIFSMFFGSGNLIYPLEVGIRSGSCIGVGIVGFLLTAVLLPFIGLFAMILFDGDYNAFFNRLGLGLGQFLIGACMMVLGPVIAIPRLITLSHVMIVPFIPWNFLRVITIESSLVFALVFAAVTFIATYKPTRIIDLIGNIITPILLLSLGIIIIQGLWYGQNILPVHDSSWHVFIENLLRGYETLDLIGGIFFASIVINMIKSGCNTAELPKKSFLFIACLKAGLMSCVLLSLVYIGMSFLGAYYGALFAQENIGQLFSSVSFFVLGSCGALVIASAVFMACLSTAIALSAVVSRYIQNTLFNNNISYMTALIITLVSCMPLSTYGLSTVLSLTAGPLVYVGYPVIIALTICNILYKLYGFRPVVLPVLVTFCAALYYYIV